MTFLYPLMFGGMFAVGLPVILHLLMRQKPKHVMFPAFRFLQQRAKTNQRKIRLRHLLLLLLRMLLIALISLALVRPRIFSDRTGGSIGPNQTVKAVLVIDTSPSMDYNSGGKSRLDDAKQRAIELLDEFHENSRIAIVDTSDPGREWMSPTQAREKVRSLTTKAGSQSVTTALSVAYDVFLTPDPATNQSDNDELPRFLYILGDRTVASWDGSRTSDLAARRDKLQPPDIVSFFVDVGVEKPIDVAITSVDLKPQSVPTNQDVVIKATVTATGQGCDEEIQCKIVGDNKTVERKPVKLEAGQTDVIAFIYKGLKPGQYQAELTLAANDALPSNNARYVTFEVRIAQKLLIITDAEDYARIVDAAIEAQGDYDCDIMVFSPEKIPTADDLKPYRSVFLLSVAHPKDLWEPLDAYVSGGGHLLVIPGREEMNVKEYDDPPAAKKLLPGKFEKDIAVPGEKGAIWKFTDYRHPMLKRFKEWAEAGVSFMKNPRTTNHLWLVTPYNKQNVILPYDLKDSPPAVLEKAADRRKDSGRVLMFTTAFDYREDQKPWNNFAATTDAAFLVSLINEAIRYCLGDLSDLAFNFTSGQALALPLPLAARFPEYQINGPGLTGSDTKLSRSDTDAELRLRQTGFAGNYVVSAVGAPWNTKFSLNPPTNEFQLDRVPIEEIEKLFGPDSVVAAESNKKITTAIGSKTRQPIDLFAMLMVLFVLAFCVECFLANRFYKPEEKPLAA